MSKRAFRILVCLAGVCSACAASASPARRPPAYSQAASALRDVWAEKALAQKDGPTFSFFRDLTAPLRYVDTSFHYYPIALSAPAAPVKARVVSNGSAINALVRQPNWAGEKGIPATLRVGYHREIYGQDPRSLQGPHYAEGYLPIVRFSYKTPEGRFAQEVFAATAPGLAGSGVVLAQISYQGSAGQKIEVQLEHPESLIEHGRSLTLPDGRAVAWFDSSWEFNKYRNALSAWVKPGQRCTFALATEPTEPSALPAVDVAVYEDLRQKAAALWSSLVASKMTVSVPEPLVNNAWRSLIVGSYVCLNGDEIRYSAGNQYAKLYESEGGDAARSLMEWGREEDTRRMIPPLLDFTRKNMEYYQAALKLNLLARFYWLSRDADFVRQMRPRWEKEVNRILDGRTENGMLPREKYCGDIDTMVYSLNSNANCWRALRDFSVVVNDIGDAELAQKMRAEADVYRRIILDAVDRSIDRSVSPPFIPVALFGEEKPYRPITGSYMGGYWNLMIQFVLGSGVFAYDSKYADDIIAYDRENGGLCMNLLRTRGNTRTFWVGDSKINDLYTLRHNLTLLQRDEADRVLAAFYGKLAQGMTRDTFISGEGADIAPLDERGRLFYLPPNSAGNGHFLLLLRNLVVQDWDMDDDGQPDTLRLLFATPRQWLEDGQQISVREAPTALGPVTLTARSQIARARVKVDVVLPSRAARRTLLKLRLPGGRRVLSATVNGRPARLPSPDVLDLTGLAGRAQIIAQVSGKGR